MSNRPDLLPADLLKELEKLQNEVPSFPGKEAVKIIEQEFSKPINHLFSEFSLEPVASASIAQVHKAKLINGDIVAVKVQRPNIRETIEIDIEIMYHLAKIIEKNFKNLETLTPVEIVKEFEKTIKKELNFTIEAGHVRRFKKNFEHDKSIYVPKIYDPLVSKKVLTLEYIDGVKVSNIQNLLDKNYDTKLIAQRGGNLVLKQIFNHGFFHADPHPGNIFILEDNVICFLDFGMMGVLSEKHISIWGNLIIGLVNKDIERTINAIKLLSKNKFIDDMDQFELEISELVDEYAFIPIKNIHIGELLREILGLLLHYKIKINPDFYLLLKSFITIEGVGKRLDPDFNLIEFAKPFVKKLLRKQLSPIKISKDFYLSSLDFINFFKILPSNLQEVIEQVKYGKIKIIFEHRGLENFFKTLDQISNRIVFAIVLAALIVGSSLIILSGVPPKWNDIPIIGIIGYIGAGLMGFWLLISILRHGKM